MVLPKNVRMEAEMSLKVNYAVPWDFLVKMGRYDEAMQMDPDRIARGTKNSRHALVMPPPNPPQKEVLVSLISFFESHDSDEAIGMIKEAGYRPGNLRELLTLGIQAPNLQERYPILALGEKWIDERRDVVIGSLSSHEGRRRLRTRRYGATWRTDCRFLAAIG